MKHLKTMPESFESASGDELWSESDAVLYCEETEVDSDIGLTDIVGDNGREFCLVSLIPVKQNTKH